MTDIPVLYTDRLVLRGPRRGDFDSYADFYGSDRTRHISGPRSRADAWTLFASDAGHWSLMGFGWWIVTRDEAVAGTVGFHHPPHHADVEIGWNVHDGFDGQGIASEAARAALNWAVTGLRASRIVSYIAAANAASIALAQKLGATRLAEPAAHDGQSLVFLHDPESFR